MSKRNVSPAGHSDTSTESDTKLRKIAAKVREVAGACNEEGYWRGCIAIGALFKEAYDTGAWQRNGSQIGDRLKGVSTDRQELWTDGHTPVWKLDAYFAVVEPLTSHLMPPTEEKEQLELEAGIAADEIEEEAKRIETGVDKGSAPLDEFTVTLKDLYELTGRIVSVKTIQNRGGLPPVVGKRGKQFLRRYSDMLTWWPGKNFEAPLPDEPTARKGPGAKR